MIALTIFLFCVFAALGTGILSGYSDFRGLKIPNGYSAVILGLFPLCYAALWILDDLDIFQSLTSHLLALLLVFAITAALFSFGVMGAADSKLGSAFALWVGLQGLVPFLFVMSIAGAMLALISLMFKKRPLIKNPRPDSWIDVVQKGGNKVPYGIAIVIGAFYSFHHIGYLQLQTLVNAFNL